jgi:hypothetical protein
VRVEVEPGRDEWLPTAWTSIGPVDPFVTLAAGRSLFRVEDLDRLAVIISELSD